MAKVINIPRRAPAAARKDEGGNRFYEWTGRGPTEQFYSVTTMIGMGVPKYGLPPWYARMAAELAYADVEQRGKRALKHWARQGALWVKQQRADGAKLARIDESPQGLALRWLKGAAERARDAAADKGSAVHEASEDLVKELAREGARLYIAGDLPAFDERIDPHMASFIRWVNDFRPRFLSAEATVFNRTESYAGTCDAFLEIWYRGRWMRLAVDYKSGNRIYAEVAMQVMAYARGEFVGGADGVTEFPVPEVEGTAVLHLTPKGYDFKFLRFDDAIWRAFLIARENFRWVIETSKTAIGEAIPQDLEDALAASVEAI
ncbi:MAG TPA: hypothetical protein VEW95_09340 [Candidatus Limnocylindrales bacterium]|nr:hypothetical protein [Candidatus Limnocylindrales bacterium]